MMKKMTFGVTAFFASLSILGMLFKVMHWPGAGIGLVTGVAGFALFAVPLLAVYKYRISS